MDTLDTLQNLENQDTNDSVVSPTPEKNSEKSSEKSSDNVQTSRAKMFASILDEVDTAPIKKSGTVEDSEAKEDSEATNELKTLTDAAKKLGIEVADIYKLSLKLRESGEPVTLGSLKDFYQENDDLSIKQIEWGEQKVKEEQELVQARKEIEVLASLLPKGSLKPEALEQARTIVMSQLEKQRNDLLKRVPEWNDIEVRKADISEIDKHLNGYGLAFGELKDARIAHYIRNTWLREQRINKALEKVREVKNPTHGPTSRAEGKKSSAAKVSNRAASLAKNFLNEDF